MREVLVRFQCDRCGRVRTRQRSTADGRPQNFSPKWLVWEGKDFCSFCADDEDLRYRRMKA